MKYFESGQFRSPEELASALSRLNHEHDLGGVSIIHVREYLQGVLDRSDYDSPLHKAFGGHSMRLSDIDENVARQALTTLDALVHTLGIQEIK